MRACISSLHSSLGDTLACTPALKAWHESHRHVEIEAWVEPRLFELYRHIPFVNRTVDNTMYGPNDPDGCSYILRPQIVGATHQSKHISELAAESMGLDLGSDPRSLRPIFKANEEPHEKGLVLVAPFSASCPSLRGERPYKMLSMQAWRPIVEKLRTLGPVGVLGWPSQDATEAGFTEHEHYRGLSLNKVALMLRDAYAVVAVDSGIGHLAHAMYAPTVLLVPVSYGARWVAHLGNPRACSVALDFGCPEPVRLADHVHALAKMMGDLR